VTYVIKRKLQSVVGGGRGDAPSVPGAPGAAGVMGTMGAMGTPGVPGVPGMTGATGVDGITTIIHHIQTSGDGVIQNLPSLMDTLTVNRLVVRKSARAPFGTNIF